MFATQECPHCKKKGVIPSSSYRVVINGMLTGIPTVECKQCGWKQPEEEAVDRYKEWIAETDRLNKWYRLYWNHIKFVLYGMILGFIGFAIGYIVAGVI